MSMSKFAWYNKYLTNQIRFIGIFVNVNEMTEIKPYFRTTANWQIESLIKMSRGRNTLDCLKLALHPSMTNLSV